MASNQADPSLGPARGSQERAVATARWVKEGIDEQVAVYRDRVREEYKKSHPGCRRREAHEYAWAAAIAKFPPAGAESSPTDPLEQECRAHYAPNTPSRGESGRIQGLGDIPKGWPALPDNASLQAEVAWVQANRLVVVDERPSGSAHVHLDRARSPAPSWAALGWLETSIRSYAKYVEVAAKTTATQVDEQELVRRERMKIEEIRRLLDQMHRDERDS